MRAQVTRSSDLAPHELSPQEEDTIAAIVEASSFPLSIVVVGVGDGEDGWALMREFDDKLPSRRFDNFQFVPFSETLTGAYASIRAAGITDPERIRQVSQGRRSTWVGALCTALHPVRPLLVPRRRKRPHSR